MLHNSAQCYFYTATNHNNGRRTYCKVEPLITKKHQQSHDALWAALWPQWEGQTCGPLFFQRTFNAATFLSRRGLSKVTSTCLTWSSDFVIWFSCCLSMQRWTSLGFTNCWPHILLQTLLADFMVPSRSWTTSHHHCHAGLLVIMLSDFFIGSSVASLVRLI